MPAERPPSPRRTARMAAVLAVLIGGVLGADLAALQRKPEWDARPPPGTWPRRTASAGLRRSS